MIWVNIHLILHTDTGSFPLKTVGSGNYSACGSSHSDDHCLLRELTSVD